MPPYESASESRSVSHADSQGNSIGGKGLPPYGLTVPGCSDLDDTFDMPNYRRYPLPGHPVFLTIVTHDRRPWLGNDSCIEILLASMRWAKTRYPFRHLAHVVLPDHMHLMLLPNQGRCSDLVGAIKRDTTWRLKESGLLGPFWQNRFYDHIIRDDEDFGRHLDYLHYNPVKHGYVSSVADYRWSSFLEWVQREVYPKDWGSVAPEGIQDMDLE